MKNKKHMTQVSWDPLNGFSYRSPFAQRPFPTWVYLTTNDNYRSTVPHNHAVGKKMVLRVVKPTDNLRALDVYVLNRARAALAKEVMKGMFLGVIS